MAVCREVHKYGAGFFRFICRGEGARPEASKIEERDIVKEVGSQAVFRMGARVFEHRLAYLKLGKKEERNDESYFSFLI